MIKTKSKFYITTPIYYINDQPHIGHAYATMAADALARYHRQLGQEVLFLTGTDENSQKTVRAAAARKEDPVVYTEKMATKWRQTWDKFSISYDRFIRTTEPAHHQAVREIFERINQAGDIYKDTYEGLYCVGHEAFLRPDELENGKCPEHGTIPEKVEEENYFFKLNKYQQQLLEHIQQNPDFIRPITRRNEVVAFLREGLEDISISRAKQDWGIPLPIDENQVVYVWFDALINYLSGVGYPDKRYQTWWPADLHLIGKDIIKFHCVIWPAMLLSAGLPLPKSIFAHGFFTVEGQKISKSLGNAIDPVKLADTYGAEVLRYYLLREIPTGSDGEFSIKRLKALYDSELANDLGNLVQRVATMVQKYQAGAVGKVPAHSHDVSRYHQAMEEGRLDLALDVIWELIRGMNQLIEEEKPWEMAKTDEEALVRLLRHLVSDLGQIADLLLPFMPQTAARIVQTFAGNKVHPEVGILFPKEPKPKP